MGSNVVCSTELGNARASVRGTDSRTIHAFFMSLSDDLIGHKWTDMSALSNASSRSGGQEPTHIGLTSNVIPKGKLQRGVSVEYTLDPTKKWHVLRVSYGRSMKASEHIAKLQIDFYHPLHKVVK